MKHLTYLVMGIEWISQRGRKLIVGQALNVTVFLVAKLSSEPRPYAQINICLCTFGTTNEKTQTPTVKR